MLNSPVEWTCFSCTCRHSTILHNKRHESGIIKPFQLFTGWNPFKQFCKISCVIFWIVEHKALKFSGVSLFSGKAGVTEDTEGRVTRRDKWKWNGLHSSSLLYSVCLVDISRACYWFAFSRLLNEICGAGRSVQCPQRPLCGSVFQLYFIILERIVTFAFEGI